MAKMRANVFQRVNEIRVEEVERPVPGIGDYRIVTTLCPGGKERTRRLLAMVQTGRFDPAPLLTHTFALDASVRATGFSAGERLDKVMKVAIRP